MSHFAFKAIILFLDLTGLPLNSNYYTNVSELKYIYDSSLLWMIGYRTHSDSRTALFFGEKSRHDIAHTNIHQLKLMNAGQSPMWITYKCFGNFFFRSLFIFLIIIIGSPTSLVTADWIVVTFDFVSLVDAITGANCKRHTKYERHPKNVKCYSMVCILH